MEVTTAMKYKTIDKDLVYKLLKQVPRGRVTSYKALAKAAGHPNATRAIGGLMRRNPYAPIVPCHRVVYNDGRLGGFNGQKGVRDKVRILAKEGVDVKGGRIVGFEKRYFNDFSVRAARRESLE
jgi:O-6-methylguanine DNA methyltransferase